MNKLASTLGVLIYKFAPVKKNRFCFTSFAGHYSDNTKYISIKLHEMEPDAEIIWLVEKRYMSLVPDYAKAIDINSLQAYWYRGTAAVMVDNVYGYRALFKYSDGVLYNLKYKLNCMLHSKSNQPIIATMHGTPIKKLGRDQVDNTVLDLFCPNTYLLVGDDHSKKVYERVTFNRIPVIVTGSPRNDILFKLPGDIRKLYGLPQDKKIILYAPTFRNDGKDVEGKNVFRSGIDQINQIDFEELFKVLSEKFSGEWVMVCRFHYHVEKMVNWDELEEKYPGKFINGNLHDDMAGYLAGSDILMTDSSSCMYDFSLTKKPCFLFFPDIDHYRDKERGFYLDLNSMPFPVAQNFDELIHSIRTFCQSDYEKKVNHLLLSTGSMNDGESADRIVRFVMQLLKGRRHEVGEA